MFMCVGVWAGRLSPLPPLPEDEDAKFLGSGGDFFGSMSMSIILYNIVKFNINIVCMYVCKDSALPAHARTRAHRPAAPHQSSGVSILYIYLIYFVK